MDKKQDRIFITDNPMAQSSLKNEVIRAFRECAKLETLIKDFGLPLTREIVTDCLTLRKDFENVPADGTTKFVGEKSEAERFAHEFKPVEVWRNSKHLRAAFDEIIKEVEADGEHRAIVKQRKEALRNDFGKLLEDIYNVFHVNRLTINTGELLRYFDIKEDAIILVPDFDERIKEDTATYATKANSKAACTLHRDIAKQLNKLGDLMKNVPRYEFAAELDKLFFMSEDGTIQATPIDYDLFT